MERARLRLYLVTDFERCGPSRFFELLPSLVDAGVSIVQLRDKASSTRELLRLARAMIEILRPRRVPVLVNDRADIALAAGADGVHVGERDLPAHEARRMLGPGAIIGASIERAHAEAVATASGADYLAVSPVYATPSKLDAAAPLGLEGVRALRALTELPIVGIGGIDASNAGEVMSFGADGVAVISAILAADDPREAARALRAAVEEAKR